MVSYSDSPPPAGRKYRVERIDTRDLTRQERLAIRTRLAHEKKQAQTQTREWLERESAADTAVKEALAALSAADAAEVKGRVPLPGERRGNVDGDTRLTQAYFDRQERLAHDTALARDRLAAAYRLRDELVEP